MIADVHVATWREAYAHLLSLTSSRRNQLYAIYVFAAHYGTGVGQALFDQTLGGGAAMLWVAKENPRATAFYRRNGFRLDGVEQIDPYTPIITDARMVR
ncbi:GNAT family N-acetyltransferase [Microbacterium kribbense]|uniref:GNAT family N-acetyltransferase n=1 Tax=Microbacterium kribbense TaxID=433645 RepID=UPI0031D89434